MSFLITGCGRSATKYISIVLDRCGLDVGHEANGLDGTVSSLYCFDDEWYPMFHEQRARPKFDLVLHQVRHPLDVIASLQTAGSWHWTCRHLPVDESAPLLVRCCYNWLVFNLEAEEQAPFTYRVEDLKEAWPILQGFLGITASYESVRDVPKTVNHREHDDVTWRDIRSAVPEAYDKIRYAANRYGY